MPDQPTVGQVMDGYRYRGGDPGQQSSWEPVQQQPQAPQTQWPAGATRLPNGNVVMRNPRGGVTNLGRSQPDFTEAAAKAGEYASRMQGAEGTLATVEYNTGRTQRTLGDNTMSGFLAGDEGSAGPLNAFRSSTDQQLEQAQREWIAALLRRDTGAAVTPQEFRLYGPMYLPQPGDSPAVIEQKRAARERAFNGLVGSSEGHFQHNFGSDYYPGVLSGRSPLDRPALEQGRQRTRNQQAAQPAPQRPAPPRPAPSQTTRNARPAQPTPQRQAAPARPAPANNGRTVRMSTGRMITPAQLERAQRIPGGPRGATGTQTNPSMINSDAEYDRLPRGHYFIGGDGVLRRRP